MEKRKKIPGVRGHRGDKGRHSVRREKGNLKKIKSAKTLLEGASPGLKGLRAGAPGRNYMSAGREEEATSKKKLDE